MSLPRAGIVSIVLLVLCVSLAGCGSADAPRPVDTTVAGRTAASIDPGPGPSTFSASVRLDPVAEGLDSPIALVARPGREQLWVAERAGRIRVITRVTTWDAARGRTNRAGYTLETGTVLDLTDLTSTEGERGLLGIAFSSDGQTLYVDHTSTAGDIIVASYAVVDQLDYSGAPPTTRPTNGIGGGADTGTTVTTPPSAGSLPGPVSRPQIDPASRRILLAIPHRGASNHNGGQLALGPDGYLYIGTGDGGRPSDAVEAQDPRSLLGKILRIDPAVTDGPNPYAIPSTNPFARGGGAPEVWALGLRNPWRFSFDRTTGDLWIGDVGQSDREEIDRLAHDADAGANFGWPIREGDLDHDTSVTIDPAVSSDLVEPVATYEHTDGKCAITGGFLYRGAAIAALQGIYVYGDNCISHLRGLLSRNGVRLDDHALTADVDPGTLVSFGQDDQGELYVVSSSGTISVLAGTR
jgi:glucose/arabinose dehydrogenase